MSNYLLPSAEAIQPLLAMIYGEELVVEESSEMDLNNATHVGVFESGDGEVVGLCHCDLQASSSMSCALSLIPPNMAEEMIKEQSLSDIAHDNLNEIMNMFSSLYMNDNTDHLRLTQTIQANATPEATLTRRVDLKIPTAKYPGGLVTFQVL